MSGINLHSPEYLQGLDLHPPVNKLNKNAHMISLDVSPLDFI